MDLLSTTAPWRTFRWYRGQKHYSGTYWAATESAHVIYESRLELSRLLYADFDFAVRRIVPQPFLLKAMVDDRERRHVPDLLLIDAQGPIVVDVKPLAQLDDPRVRFSLGWSMAAASSSPRSPTTIWTPGRRRRQRHPRTRLSIRPIGDRHQGRAQ